MICQCWTAALRPMRKFGRESGPAKCLDLALVYFEAKFVTLMRCLKDGRPENACHTLHLSQKPKQQKAAFCHCLSKPSEVHAAAVSSDAYTPKSEVDVQQLKWLLDTKDAWHLEHLGFDQVEVSIALGWSVGQVVCEAKRSSVFEASCFCLFSLWSEVRGRCATF